MSLESEIEFSFKLLPLLNATEESTVYSPASVLNTLSMIYVGAEGETAKQIEEIIGGKNVDKNGIIKYYSEFVKSVSEIREETQKNLRKRKASDKSDIKISMANRLFVFDEYNFLPTYEKLIQDSFNGGSQKLDNSKSAESAKIINKFVETSTNGVIKEVIEAKDINERTPLIIVNAIHFLGYWEMIFGRRENEKFYGFKETRKIDMMHQFVESDDKWNFRSGDNWKALGIPYKSRKAWFFIVLPDAKNGLPDLLKIFDYKMFKDVTTKEGTDEFMHVEIPKMNILTDIDLIKQLSKLGITDLFSQNCCDLSGMLNGKHYIGKGIHKAVIRVDEIGTEASAVTVGIPVACSSSGYFRADHPFLYFITTSKKPDKIEPKNILFIGTFC